MGLLNNSLTPQSLIRDRQNFQLER